MRRTNLVLQQSSNPIIQQSFAFDAASRLKQVTDYTTANNAYSVGYTYLANSPLVGQIAFTNNGSWRMMTSKQKEKGSVMAWLLGTYTSRFNRRHKEFGHLFSGRYKSLIVERVRLRPSESGAAST